MSYRAFLTPLEKKNVYGEEIEITDFVLGDDIGTIEQLIDQGDYGFGAYVFSDSSASCDNKKGQFSRINQDSRSIFPFGRDLAKVRFEFDSTASYKGIINEEDTRASEGPSTVSFSILSEDSILRKTIVSPDVVNNGDLISVAISKILALPSISSILGTTSIDLAIDQTIDDAFPYEEQEAKAVLGELLLMSNSVLIIEDSSVIVTSREEREESLLFMFGPGSVQENIQGLEEENNGLHRAFNSVTIGDQTAEDRLFIDEFTLRKASFSVSGVTDPTKLANIAENMVETFKTPKMEILVTMDTEVAEGVKILGLVVIDYKPSLTGPDLGQLPICGSAISGEFKAPTQNGGMIIEPNIGWKVIGKFDDTTNETTTLKLRQVGTTLSDGVIERPTWGYEIWGEFIWA